ncbi:MAG: DUF4184 family protein [Steroidobacteraceae bacterium]|nr:DUF4184 family protein [Steroidobacteraceae bacterium]
MPFTVSHAAAALPVHALFRRLPMAALMIGSMAPDFAFFVPFAPFRSSTHSIAGLFTFCLPVGLVVWYVFLRWMEHPTMALLPDAWREKLIPTGPITLRLLGLAAIGIVLGAGTHNLWDSFTHSHTWVTSAVPSLRERQPGLGGAPLYHLLQVASSVIGLAVLTMWLLNLRNRPMPEAPFDWSRADAAITNGTRVMAAATLVFAAVAAAFGYFEAYAEYNSGIRIFSFMIGTMTGFALAWLAISIWVAAKLRRARDVPQK